MGLMEEYKENDVKGGLRIMIERRQATMSSTNWKDITKSQQTSCSHGSRKERVVAGLRAEVADVEDENWSMVGWPRRRQ